MVNPFPILFLAPLAYTILRATAGAYLLHFGLNLFGPHPPSPSRYMGVVLFIIGICEIILGTFFILGMATQYTALSTIVLLTILSSVPMLRQTLYTPPSSTRVLLIIISLALCITGAGAFAYDLPI